MTVEKTIEHIYLIDDEEDSHFVTRLVLKKAGYAGRVSVFHTAPEAYEALRSAPTPPDLILVDINMPGVNGHEFVRMCEQHALLPNGRTSVVMFSSSTRPQDMEAARGHASVAGFLEKALTVDRFNQIQLLHRQRA